MFVNPSKLFSFSHNGSVKLPLRRRVIDQRIPEIRRPDMVDVANISFAESLVSWKTTSLRLNLLLYYMVQDDSASSGHSSNGKLLKFKRIKDGMYGAPGNTTVPRSEIPFTLCLRVEELIQLLSVDLDSIEVVLSQQENYLHFSVACSHRDYSYISNHEGDLLGSLRHVVETLALKHGFEAHLEINPLIIPE